MRQLTLADIKPIEAYLQERQEFRRRVIAIKKVRRVAVGPRVSVVFENVDTMRFQVQEMARIEHITDPRELEREVEVYNDLLPPGPAIGATLLIELTQQEDIPAILRDLSGIEEQVSLVFGERRVRGEPQAVRSREDTTSSIHYLTFRFEEADGARLADAGEVALEIDHPRYRHRAVLAGPTVAALVGDLL
ncbi:MAG: DUF3501 family protein, partial [Firmicutes bacterium]|nr:DUF3501 family protein [Bacillota bacterium]